MGVKLGEAFVEVTARLDKLEAGLGHAETKTKGWAGRLGGFMTNALSFTVGGLIQQGVNGITNAMSGLVQGMVGGNAEFEQYQMRFEVLLKSADAAKQRLAELADFGAKTPFDLPEVVRADTVLQGFGLHSEEAAKRFGYSGAQIRTIAGDVASGSGASFEQIAGYLGKFSAGATGEAIMRFQELGIVTRKQLADMGVQFDKAGSLTSPVEGAMNTLLKIMSQKYDGMMSKQSKTFTGMLSNMRDWVGKTLRLVGQPIFEKLRSGLEGLLGFLDSPAVQGAITTFAGWMANGIDGAIKSVESLVKTLTNSPIAKTISTIVTDIKEEGLGGAIRKWIGNAIDTLTDPAKRAALIASLGASITTIAEGARAYYEANIAPGVTALGETIAVWVQSSIDWLRANNRKISFDLGAMIGDALAGTPQTDPFSKYSYGWLVNSISTWLRNAISEAFSPENMAVLWVEMNLAMDSFALGFYEAINPKLGGILTKTIEQHRANVESFQKQKDALPKPEKPTGKQIGPVTEGVSGLTLGWKDALDAVIKYKKDGDLAPTTPVIGAQTKETYNLEGGWHAAADAVRAYLAELAKIPPTLPPPPTNPPTRPPGGNIPNSGAMPNRAPVSIVINAAGFAPAAVTRAALTAVDLLRARGAI
ncbi:hypothetical protein [Candidatus Amarolinea dominans]|uniref:hypothetical protein n=1 Tax=Candidatus Amarolinea dominans TaxID=3140696 RepID=UPI0031358C14|nr:hypothetical protein [Anaerolineae bacterium]